MPMPGVRILRNDSDCQAIELDNGTVLAVFHKPSSLSCSGRIIEGGKGIFGICMGNQLLGKAGGASVYKLKYGHRSHNQPVRMVGTNRCFITSQNHGYAVDSNTLGNEWIPWFVNMNDGSNEGIRHRTNPWFSVQFHPEAASGPTDTAFLFDEFVELLKNR